MKFEVDQRVRVARILGAQAYNIYVGKTGEIREISGYGYHVVFDDTGQEVTFREGEVALIEPV